MMASELPFDEEDDHYPEGKLPLLSAVEEQSSDSEEVVVFEKSDSIPNTTAVAINEPDDEMVTVNLSDGEPDFTEIITRDQKVYHSTDGVNLLMEK